MMGKIMIMEPETTLPIPWSCSLRKGSHLIPIYAAHTPSHTRALEFVRRSENPFGEDPWKTINLVLKISLNFPLTCVRLYSIIRNNIGFRGGSVRCEPVRWLVMYDRSKLIDWFSLLVVPVVQGKKNSHRVMYVRANARMRVKFGPFRSGGGIFECIGVTLGGLRGFPGKLKAPLKMKIVSSVFPLTGTRSE